MEIPDGHCVSLSHDASCHLRKQNSFDGLRPLLALQYNQILIPLHCLLQRKCISFILTNISLGTSSFSLVCLQLLELPLLIWSYLLVEQSATLRLRLDHLPLHLLLDSNSAFLPSFFIVFYLQHFAAELLLKQVKIH